jgi:FdhE protein
MAVTTAARLLSPEEMALRAGQQLPFLRLPLRASVCAERELRLRQLAGLALRLVGSPALATEEARGGA